MQLKVTRNIHATPFTNTKLRLYTKFLLDLQVTVLSKNFVVVRFLNEIQSLKSVNHGFHYVNFEWTRYNEKNTASPRKKTATPAKFKTRKSNNFSEKNYMQPVHNITS